MIFSALSLMKPPIFLRVLTLVMFVEPSIEKSHAGKRIWKSHFLGTSRGSQGEMGSHFPRLHLWEQLAPLDCPFLPVAGSYRVMPTMFHSHCVTRKMGLAAKPAQLQRTPGVFVL